MYFKRAHKLIYPKQVKFYKTNDILLKLKADN